MAKRESRNNNNINSTNSLLKLTMLFLVTHDFKSQKLSDFLSITQNSIKSRQYMALKTLVVMIASSLSYALANRLQ